MLDLFLNAVKRRLGDERGMALPLALGVTVIISSLAAGIFSYATTNQGAAHRATADQKAYGLAEAGLSQAMSVLFNASPPYTVSGLPSSEPASSPTAGSPAGSQHWGTLSGSTWTLYGKGTVANPSGPGSANVTRTVSTQVQIATTTISDLRPYNYFFVDQPSGCFTLQNTVTLEIAIYVRGDLCLENNTHLYGPAVHVLGNVYVNSPQSSVGTLLAPVPDFSITGNCYRNGVLIACNVSAVSQVWASTYGTNPPDIPKPAYDLPGTYSTADLGPLAPCTTLTGAGFPGFDNDTTMNVSKGNVVLTPTTAYDCQKIVAGVTVAQIKWVPGGNPSQWGTLTIKGKIFFDGNLAWGNLTKIQYDGVGSIYASGTLVMENQTKICGVTTCDENWDPDVDFLMFVVGSMTSGGAEAPVTGDIGNQGTFQGGLYLENDYDQDNNTTIWGPVIARNAVVANSGLFKPLPGGTFSVPSGLPAGTTTTTQLQNVPGSYAG